AGGARGVRPAPGDLRRGAGRGRARAGGAHPRGRRRRPRQPAVGARRPAGRRRRHGRRPLRPRSRGSPL
ncbi:MAG: hypothetical protein AVDCRST_MAG38-1721, partial [uncultured Solirubrobacteraceae bacterium]